VCAFKSPKGIVESLALTLRRASLSFFHEFCVQWLASSASSRSYVPVPITSLWRDCCLRLNFKPPRTEAHCDSPFAPLCAAGATCGLQLWIGGWEDCGELFEGAPLPKAPAWTLLAMMHDGYYGHDGIAQFTIVTAQVIWLHKEVAPFTQQRVRSGPPQESVATGKFVLERPCMESTASAVIWHGHHCTLKDKAMVWAITFLQLNRVGDVSGLFLPQTSVYALFQRNFWNCWKKELFSQSASVLNKRNSNRYSLRMLSQIFWPVRKILSSRMYSSLGRQKSFEMLSL